jgi:hypothetical protein
MNLRPTTPSDLKAALTRGTVEFAFKKLGGELRTAIGTTRLGLIPLESHPKGVRPAPQSVIAFFDIEKREWRAVSVNSEIFINQ